MENWRNLRWPRWMGTAASLGLAVVIGVGCGQSAAPPAAAPTQAPAAQPAAAPTSAPAPVAEPTKAVAPSTSQFEVVRSAAEAYLTSDKTKTPNISAADLYVKINDGDKASVPPVLSVRAPADYAKGHIPGANNIPWRELAKAENVAKLPRDKQIVVYCYTGHTGSQDTALLNLMGFNAINLQFGMCGWTKDPNVATGCFDDKESKDYKFETTPNTATQTFGAPKLDVAKSTEKGEILRAAADAYLVSDKAKTPNISAADLYMNLNDGDKANDPFVVDVRAPADYAKAHVPGAINIPWQQIAKSENAAKLPPDKQIVVYCYTGHTGSQAAALLNAMGYNVLNMKFGMSAWTRNPDIAPTRFDKEKVKDYKTVPGTNPF